MFSMWKDAKTKAQWNAFDNLFKHGTALFRRRPDTPIEILKRLQREAFSDLLKVKDRLHLIEKRWSAHEENTTGFKTQFKGQVNTGGVVAFSQDTNDSQQQTLELARINTGVQSVFKFETFFRERDLLVTEFAAGDGLTGDADISGAPLTLSKILYNANVNDTLSLSFAPFGAKGKDLTFLEKTSQNSALTEENSPDLLRHCQGSAVAATLKGQNVALSAVSCLSGWKKRHDITGSVPNIKSIACSSTLGQLTYQPFEGMIIAISYLNRFLCNPCSPSKPLRLKEISTLVLSNLFTRNRKNSKKSLVDSSSQSLLSALASQNTMDMSTHSLAFSADFEFKEGIQLGGWVQRDTPNRYHESGEKPWQWDLSLSKMADNECGWGLSIGQLRREKFCTQQGNVSNVDQIQFSPSQTQLKAFLNVPIGKGFTLQPGILYAVSKDNHAPIVTFRSNWSF